MKLILLVVSITATLLPTTRCCFSSSSVTIPQLPTFPDISFTPLESTFGKATIAPLSGAYSQLQGLSTTINDKLQILFPTLETFGSSGIEIAGGFTKLAAAMTTTDFTSPLAICYMADAAYPIIDGLVTSMEAAQSLGIPGLDDLLVPMKLLRTTCGVIRCPVNFSACVTGIFGR